MGQKKTQNTRQYMFPKKTNSETYMLPNPTTTRPGMFLNQDIIIKTNFSVNCTRGHEWTLGFSKVRSMPHLINQSRIQAKIIPEPNATT